MDVGGQEGAGRVPRVQGSLVLSGVYSSRRLECSAEDGPRGPSTGSRHCNTCPLCLKESETSAVAGAGGVGCRRGRPRRPPAAPVLGGSGPRDGGGLRSRRRRGPRVSGTEAHVPEPRCGLLVSSLCTPGWAASLAPRSLSPSQLPLLLGTVLGRTVSPQKACPPQASEHDLIWKQGLCRREGPW